MTAKVCPRCRYNFFTPYTERPDRYTLEAAPYPALSRTDNHTYICSWCGTDEAMEDFFSGGVTPIKQWPIKRDES